MNLLNVGVFGQSRIGRSGFERWTTPVAGANFYDYASNSFAPVYDPPGYAGCLWPHAAHLVLNALPKMVDQFTVAMAGENGSGSDRWTPGGDLYPRFGLVENGLRAAGLELNAIIYGQGELDATVNDAEGVYYYRVLSTVAALRASGITAPFFLCQTSHYRNGLDNSAYNDIPSLKLARLRWQRRVQDEQRELMKLNAAPYRIFPGMALDQITDMPDHCHFGWVGLVTAGLMAWEVLTTAITAGIIQLQTQPLS